MNLDVYDRANATFLGTLTEVYDDTFLDDWKIPGFGRFAVDVESSADMALLDWRRIVRFRAGNNPGEDVRWAGIIQDMPGESEDMVVEPATGETIAVVRVELRELDAWLGTAQEGGGTLHPYRGFDGRQQNPRMFGVFSPDFDDSAFASPTIGGPLSTEGWPDDQAVAFEFTSRAIYRRELPALDEEDGMARMYVAATWHTQVDVYLDTDLVLQKPEGQAGLFHIDVPYEDIDHFVAIHAVSPDGRVGRVGWTWVRMAEDVDEDGNEVLVLDSVLRRTFDPADFPDAQTDWLALENYTVLPGVDVGYVMDVALSEDGARHTRPWSWNFTGGAGGEDSDGQPWTREFTRGFRMTELGLLADELMDIQGFLRIDPSTSEILFTVDLGEDKTASVTVSSPFSLSLRGRGPVATRWLYETQGGFGESVNEPAETDLGVVMESFVQLGNDLSPDAGIADALVDLLIRDGNPLDEVDVILPPDVVPYQDVELGDRVMCVARDGTAEVRLTSFEWRPEGDEELWRATAEPV